jgi:hypothetical protein
VQHCFGGALGGKKEGRFGGKIPKKSQLSLKTGGCSKGVVKQLHATLLCGPLPSRGVKRVGRRHAHAVPQEVTVLANTDFPRAAFAPRFCRSGENMVVGTSFWSFRPKGTGVAGTKPCLPLRKQRWGGRWGTNARELSEIDTIHRRRSRGRRIEVEGQGNEKAGHASRENQRNIY